MKITTFGIFLILPAALWTMNDGVAIKQRLLSQYKEMERKALTATFFDPERLEHARKGIARVRAEMGPEVLDPIPEGLTLSQEEEGAGLGLAPAAQLRPSAEGASEPVVTGVEGKRSAAAASAEVTPAAPTQATGVQVPPVQAPPAPLQAAIVQAATEAPISQEEQQFIATFMSTVSTSEGWRPLKPALALGTEENDFLTVWARLVYAKKLLRKWQQQYSTMTYMSAFLSVYAPYCCFSNERQFREIFIGQMAQHLAELHKAMLAKYPQFNLVTLNTVIEGLTSYNFQNAHAIFSALEKRERPFAANIARFITRYRATIIVTACAAMYGAYTTYHRYMSGAYY